MMFAVPCVCSMSLLYRTLYFHKLLNYLIDDFSLRFSKKFKKIENFYIKLLIDKF